MLRIFNHANTDHTQTGKKLIADRCKLSNMGTANPVGIF